VDYFWDKAARAGFHDKRKNPSFFFSEHDCAFSGRKIELLIPRNKFQLRFFPLLAEGVVW